MEQKKIDRIIEKGIKEKFEKFRKNELRGECIYIKEVKKYINDNYEINVHNKNVSKILNKNNFEKWGGDNNYYYYVNSSKIEDQE